MATGMSHLSLLPSFNQSVSAEANCFLGCGHLSMSQTRRLSGEKQEIIFSLMHQAITWRLELESHKSRTGVQ